MSVGDYLGVLLFGALLALCVLGVFFLVEHLDLTVGWTS